MVTAWQQDRRRKRAQALQSEAAAGLEAVLGGVAAVDKRQMAEEERKRKAEADEAEMARKGVEASARMEQDQARTGILRERAKVEADKAAAEAQERETRAGVLRQKQAKDEAEAKRAETITSMARRMDTLTSRADVEKAATDAGMKPDEFLAAVAEQQEKAIGEQQKAEGKLDLDEARAEQARAAADKAKRVPVIRPKPPKAPVDPDAAGQKQAKDASSLRKEFKADPDVVKGRGSAAEYDQLNALVSQNPSAGADMAIIYSFMKVMDPGSVVKETEFASVARAGGVDDRIVNTITRAINGEIITADQRKDLLQQARVMRDKNMERAKKARKFYKGVAERSGFNPLDVVGEDEEDEAPAAAPASAAPAPAQAGGKVRVTNGSETLEIDAADLPAALADGFKVVRRG